MIKPYETINTFTRKPVVPQIITYFVFVGEAVTFFVCMYINFTNSKKQISMIIFYILTIIAQVVITLKASYSDPSDSIMMEYRNNPNGRKNIRSYDFLFCDLCTGYIKQSSRHCKVCQRCVQQFDHHCMWINNCVGSKNYNTFFAMIIITLVNMIVYIIGMILLWTEEGWKQYIGPMIAVWIFSLIALIFSILLINLIGLHIYLIYKGLTTYQFIILQRQEEKRKKQQQQKMKLQQLNSKKKASLVPETKNLEKIDQKNSSLSKSQQINSKQLRTQNNIGVNQLTAGIFANNEPSNQNNTESEERSESISENKNKKSITFSIDQNLQSRNNFVQSQPSPLTSNQDKQINVSVSNFFTKNKSLRFFIGEEVGIRPQSTTHQKYQKKSKMFKSSRTVLKKNEKNSSIFESEIKNLNQQGVPQEKSTASMNIIKLKQKNHSTIQ